MDNLDYFIAHYILYVVHIVLMVIDPIVIDEMDYHIYTLLIYIRFIYHILKLAPVDLPVQMFLSFELLILISDFDLSCVVG